jgi:uncharacterized YigZ family protein
MPERFDDPDRFAGIEDGREVEWTVQGSRFLARAFRAADEALAQSRLQSVRRTYHDATHHCWAARFGLGDEPRERWDDDGEPSGSAGVPILGSIRHAGVTDVLLIVSRYFGGTKLGTGGLVRAYSRAARLALLEAPPRAIWRRGSLVVECAFEQLGIIEGILSRAGSALLEVERGFEPEPRFVIDVKRSRLEEIAGLIVESTGGRARVRLG